MHKTTFQKLLVFVVIMGVLVPSGGAFSQNQRAEIGNQIFLPLVFRNYPPIFLTDMWVSNSDHYQRNTFLPTEEIHYVTVGDNPIEKQIEVDLQWDQVGPCGITQIFTSTLSLEPGPWENSLVETTPDCLGTYTNTVQLVYQDLIQILTTTFEVVDYTSEIVVSNKQGFDKCGLPAVEQMEAWWQESPYWVFNIYLGGSNFACDNPQLNIDWVWQVSQQGWEFILTWVGPQSPCFDTIKPKISLDPDIAYQQGRNEANLAVAAAEKLGLGGDKIVYYDVEGYSDLDTGACSKAVDSFLTGWTAHLHEQGLKAGAYGSPCRSFIGDWWDNQPLLDDIWFASWLLPAQYRPDVTVWGDKCTLTDDMWANNQRLRQYAGDHPEEWGGVYLGSIDSNVLLGEITAVTTTMPISATSSTLTTPVLPEPLLRKAQLLNANIGWVLKGNQLLWTPDAGKTWDNITPSSAGSILDVDFPDIQNGWAASLNDQGELLLHQTDDSGANWQASRLPFPTLDVGAVYLDFVDAQTGWIVLKMASSSSFSIGQLFATQDGGRTWEEHPIPLGEPVQFSDALHGWVVGGPTEDEFYRTIDGGKSWLAAPEQVYRAANIGLQPTLYGNLPVNTVQVSKTDAENAWALTQSGSCSGEKTSTSLEAGLLLCRQQTLLWTTQDGGQTWQKIGP